MKLSDEHWMRRCLTLARKGAGLVSPNPMVGAVIVKNGRKIAEGHHERFGGPHAEINAIRNAAAQKRGVKNATIYVSLEPCSHHGKTPPCVNAIIHAGFRRVVIAAVDPNPLVAGKGINKLKKHGIRCDVGILQKEAEHQNEAFFKFIRTGIPFVVLKAAQTADGFIAKKDGSSRWITNEQSRKYGHRLRSFYDAVLVGARTVRRDDPELTVRMVKGRDPVRVVLDGKISTPVNSTLYRSAPRTIVYVEKHSAELQADKVRKLRSQGVEVIALRGSNGRLNVRSVLKDLGKKNIASVLIEGGQQIYSAFLNERLVDKAVLLTAKKKFKSGIKTFSGISVSFSGIQRRKKRFSSDTMSEYDIVYP